ncbi:unnamed protein product [Cyprideis torosa]|uniref:Uncharacterized protein n=1 Tax=Cyprideis torosa TaxID=163714 RepID=A0A7R8W5S6_9CRUS|nr:unnamed protein product [Cyprideis torosa]CAG0885534.1 unnamed protein product [Cyprideis torosa]
MASLLSPRGWSNGRNSTVGGVEVLSKMTSSREQPRLSNSMRRFMAEATSGFVEDDCCLDDQSMARSLLKLVIQKRKERADKECRISWSRLHTAVRRVVNETGCHECLDHLKELRSLVNSALFATESPGALVEDAVASLVERFGRKEKLDRADAAHIRTVYGPIGNSILEKVFKAVHTLLNSLPADVVSDLFRAEENGADDPDLRGHLKFGKDIEVPLQLNDDGLSNITVSPPSAYSSKGDTISTDEADALTRLMRESTAATTAAWYMKKEQEEDMLRMEMSELSASSMAPAIEEDTNEYDLRALEWDLAQAKTDGPSPRDLTDSVMSLLRAAAGKSDEGIQGELFDLLGFDRIEVIEKILSHRDPLLRSAETDTHRRRTVEKAVNKMDRAPPPISRQVVVLSEEEKRLQKQARKDERRMNRWVDKISTDEREDLQEEAMRAQEERARIMAEAARVPILRMKGAVQVEQYPHVYDSFAVAKQSSGYITGVKMSLPIGFEKEDNARFEKIHIPAAGKPPPDVGSDPVLIKHLDQIGQDVFSGMKSLNRIQSIVYETAYNTNENLLICAPTGAGKTNVALLTMTRQIKIQIENGVLRKDFKIVYVAPMKALAAEMTATFGKRLSPLGIIVRELTGDMQLTKTEILNTQVIVTTPEKWDVVTRKPGDVTLASQLKLLIIDEVHLLHGDRGPVVEALVARTLRQVESTQSMIRIVGLSATLPNYVDVAQFLRVVPYLGLFFFDGRFRPVPLATTFIGIKAVKALQQMQETDAVCFEEVKNFVCQGHQVMVFVHARNATVRTAQTLRDMANAQGQGSLFMPAQSGAYGLAQKAVSRSRNKPLRELFDYGFSTHHAGMLRSDRTLVERLFSEGHIKVLVCTATLAWGVNLPAHAVIIKGTEIYDAKQGQFVDLGILDVQQIFGRAGRPQFDQSGHGTIITNHEKLAHYLSLLTCQYPIESSFIKGLRDQLNAEISLGTVTSIDEAVEWLSYTYLFVRMRKNPHHYGIPLDAHREDPHLINFRRSLAVDAARYLDKVRDDELEELDRLKLEECALPVAGGTENTYGKVNILIQAHIARARLDAFSLVSDASYVIQNCSRIMRALFEIVLRKNWPLMAARILKLAIVIERQVWDFESPLRQFVALPPEVHDRLEALHLDPARLREMDAKEIGHLLRHVKIGKDVKHFVQSLPYLEVDAQIQPITRTVLRVRVQLKPEFKWNDRIHGGSSEPFWLWVEDPNSNFIHHHEYVTVTKKQVIKSEPVELVFTIPIFEPLPAQYYIKVMSDRWLGCDITFPISFLHLILPERHPPHTELLDLQPLPVTALKNPEFQSLYKFTHFNPIQTQIFHVLYHTDHNVLLGAPTGSGKTIAAEIAMFRVFRDQPGAKVVYIAPMKALVRERIIDWRERLERRLGRKVVELTGDTAPDIRSIQEAEVIVTTPEKWDGISRSWQTRSYVRSVSLIVIDEIHLLGEERGPVLEVIVSRAAFITSHTQRSLRVIGLSTALANAQDLAEWLGIEDGVGMFNFRPSVRPVPLEVHISGFPGKHYCPRMATMNKPTFRAIKEHSPAKPVLIFVSSRRQTRLTALDLIAFLATEDNPKEWLQMPDEDMEQLLPTVRDPNLRLCLAFGIGLHHAGLVEKDRKLVEELFVNQKIQVLIATATLAWGVNFPAHLVVVKGTEYYDGKQKRYVDFPITDVLQMMGRAGRPQFDDSVDAPIRGLPSGESPPLEAPQSHGKRNAPPFQPRPIRVRFEKNIVVVGFPRSEDLVKAFDYEFVDEKLYQFKSEEFWDNEDKETGELLGLGVAVILVHDIKKHFYKKFLYEPFPVESSLLHVLPDHINAEIVAGTLKSKQEALDYLTWTYFFRRLLQNPSYYNLESVEPQDVNVFLSSLVESSICALAAAGCVMVEDDDRTLIPLPSGRIASYYYLTHRDLARSCPLHVDPLTLDSPHSKVFLLLQAHISRLILPCIDYQTDLKSVLDQSIRILQAMVDVSTERGFLATTLRTITVIQQIVQARWIHEHPALTLPHVTHAHISCFKKFEGLPQLVFHVGAIYERLAGLLRSDFDENQIEDIFTVLRSYPLLLPRLTIKTSEGKEYEVPPNHTGLSNAKWICLPPDTEFALEIRLSRIGKPPPPIGRIVATHAGGGRRCHAPKFPKFKDEGWFLAIGQRETREILALKRAVGRKGMQTETLTCWTPQETGRLIYTFYLMSDCYLGIDQQFDLHLEICG